MECTHRFQIDSHNVGTCPCGEVRQFPWDRKEPVIVLKKGDPSISQVSKKEEHMHHESHHQIQGKHKYYEANKAAIMADLLSIGKAATRKKWNIPKGSLGKLTERWLTEERKLKIPVNLATSPGTSEETPHPSTNSTPSNGRLPQFPKFSDTWEPEVQLTWLEVYRELAKGETTMATTP